MRILFTLYLALVWLLLPYPYGLLIFALSVLGFRPTPGTSGGPGLP
jgi:hypothetical protein